MLISPSVSWILREHSDNLRYNNFWRNSVYCSWSTNNPPPPLFSIIFCFNAYYRLGKGQVCPAGLWKRFSQGPAGDRIRKKRKIKNKRGCYLCFKYKTRNGPNFLVIPITTEHLLYKCQFACYTVIFMDNLKDKYDYFQLLLKVDIQILCKVYFFICCIVLYIYYSFGGKFFTNFITDLAELKVHYILQCTVQSTFTICKLNVPSKLKFSKKPLISMK